MTTQPVNALEGLKTLRKNLADRNPRFAAAERDEERVRLACQQLRQNLRQHRKALGLDQAEIADRLEIGQSAISKIENGHGDIGIMTFLRYADAVGLAVEIALRPADDGPGIKMPESAELTEARELALQEAQEHLARVAEELSAAQERIAAAA
jgi:transcriptional regulator with XRE-family HTH domain